MVMTRSTAVGSIVTGSIMLVFAVITIICGAISAKKLSGEAASSAGLWSLYYAVPGILCIAAGASKNGVVMGFALFFNIIAVIVSAVAAIVLIIFTAALREVTNCQQSGDMCTCQYNDMDYSDKVKWNMNCNDIDTLKTVMMALLVVFVILTIVSLTASIFGCMGTCCAPTEPVVLVTAPVPVHSGGNTVVVNNQSTMHTVGYPAPVPGFGHAPLPAYGHSDTKSLVQNMAI